MGVGPDGGCGGSSGGGESWAHSTAAAARTSASETGAMILGMAAGWYHAATLNSTCDKSRGCRLLLTRCGMSRLFSSQTYSLELTPHAQETMAAAVYVRRVSNGRGVFAER